MEIIQKSNTPIEKISNSEQYKISILNKIHHKPLLFEKIFSYASKRAFVFPYLIDKDQLLKKKLKHSLEQTNKKNSLSLEFNDNICEFITYRLLYEIPFSEILSELNNKFIFLDYNDQEINSLISEIIPSMIINYGKLIKNKYLNIKKCKKINISVNKLDLFLPSDDNMILFARDYLSIQNEVILFMLPNNTIEKEINFFNDINLEKEMINEDSIYLSNAKKYCKNQKISLICLLNSEKFYETAMEVKYDNINKLYFLIDHNNFDIANIFEAIYKYLINIKHRENIIEIYFNASFLNEIETKDKNIYDKNVLQYFIEEYYLKKKEMNDFNFNFYSLEKITFNDDIMLNEINRYKLRLNLNKIFGDKVWCKIINIKISKLLDNDKNYDSLENAFKNESTDLKILYLDFENQSPYQKCFIDFCEKYLNSKANINTITIDNIGEINYDEKIYNNLINNKSKNKNFNLVNLPELKMIYYENNNINLKKQKDFIIHFLKMPKFVYEGYDINNNMIYFINIEHKITTDELLRVLNSNKKIFNLKLVLEKIDIIFDQENSHLSIINNNRDKEQIYYTKIKNFSNFIKSLHNIKELSIDGFDFTFSEIYNKDIISLNINTINDYSKNNCNFIEDYKTLVYNPKAKILPNNLSIFSNLEKFSFSGETFILNDILKNLPKKIKKIIFYVRDPDYKKINNIKKKLSEKKIIFEEIFLNKNNKKEEEEYYDEEYEENENDYYNEEYNDEYDIYDPSSISLETKKQTISNKTSNILKNELRLQNSILLTSEIIDKNNYYKMIIKGLKSLNINLNQKNYYFDIIYKASSDGDNPKSFAELCEVGEQILLIIKTNKGKIFGCYSSFKLNKKTQNDNIIQKGFFFDLTSNKIMPIGESSIFFHKKGLGPLVPRYFVLSSKYFSNENYYLDKCLELNKCESKYFYCENVEVYLLKCKK